MRPALVLAFALAFMGPLAACHRAGAQTAGEEGAPDPKVLAFETKRGAAFLAANGKKPGVVTTPSGLQYKVVHAGPVAGPHPAEGDEIKVHYEGANLDGQVFDSTLTTGQPAVMPLAHLVPGWMEALPLMRPGDEWVLYVPPALGYGDKGAGGVIPPGAVLVFKLQLLGVLPHGSAMG